MRRTVLTLLAAVALLGGCGETYAPPSLIEKLRIIAVRAEPPVLSAAAPTKLDMLVVGNNPDDTLCYAWSFCLFALAQDGNFVCLDADLEKALGTAPTASVSALDAFAMFPKIEGVFAKLGLEPPDSLTGEGGEQPDPADASGFELFVRFKVAEAATEGGTCPTDANAWLAKPCADRSRCLAGFKKLGLALSPEDSHSNPVMTGVSLQGVDWPAGVTPTVPCYLGDAEFGVLGKGAVEMTPAWTPESREEIGPNPDPSKPEPLRETMLFSWFSTSGRFDKQRSYDEAPENAFLPPEYAGQSSQIVDLWLVLRDGRNGTDWLHRQVEVKAGTPFTGHPLCRVKADLPGCEGK